jgi:hypothetical protein
MDCSFRPGSQLDRDLDMESKFAAKFRNKWQLSIFALAQMRV